MQSRTIDKIPDQLEAYDCKSLPIIATWCKNVGIDQIFNEMIPSKTNLSAGDGVIAMIMDTISGRSPLYHLAKIFEVQDTELLFGKNYQSSDFNDDAMGRLLDRIHKVGVEKIYSSIALNMIDKFDIKTGVLNFDSTSVNVWGDYNGEASTNGGLSICFGYSKDMRPDLKQFMFSMTCAEGNIPILGKTENGNSSDEVLNNETLTKLNSFLKDSNQEDTIYVADCKLICKKNLELLDKDDFVSRLPATFSEHNSAIEQCLEKDEYQWSVIENKTPATSSKMAFTKYRFHETTVVLHGRSYRAIVFYSDSKDKRKEKALINQMKKEFKAISKASNELQKEKFACEKDALTAIDKICKQNLNYHLIKGTVTAKPVFMPGKVKAGKEREIKRYDYQVKLVITCDLLAVTQKRKINSCFVLLASKGTSHLDGEGLLKVYKSQMGVENNFRFLKDPLIVNCLFLKKSTRIEALGLILLLSLLVYNLMQRSMRKYVESEEVELIGFDNKKTKKPTTYMVIWAFHSMIIVKHGTQRKIVSKITSTQRLFMEALGLSFDIFTYPPNSMID